jgi:hypothetical protein
MKRKIFIISLSFLFLANVAHAAHYVTSFNSVDNGEIRWGGSTQYLTSWN